MKKKYAYLVLTIGIVLFGLSVTAWMKEPDLVSDSERRELETFPEFSWKTISDGSFMDDFEDYVVDQFPFREAFRSLKARVSYQVFGQKDNHQIYIAEGHASEMNATIHEDMLNYAAKRFDAIYEQYLKEQGAKVYLSIVPDKNAFLAEPNGYLAYDYEELIGLMREKVFYMEYIDIASLLSLEDYYYTDSHWKQEHLPKIAEKLVEAMDVSVTNSYQEQELAHPFYGVYYGQAALPLEPDQLAYLTNEIIASYIVTCYDSGKPEVVAVYDMEKVNGKDPYELYLSGNRAVLTIENPLAESEKELIVFRDSFGSSLLPLLAQGYAKVTVLDIRYISSDILDQYVEFHGQDTLFLYSTLLLNNSLALK